MKLCIKTNLEEYWGDLCEEARLFLPVRKIEKTLEELTDDEDNIIIEHKADGFMHTAVLYHNGTEKGRKNVEAFHYPIDSDALTKKKYAKRAAKNCVFGLLSEYTGKNPLWGSLTGVRPTKLYRDSVNNLSEENAKKLFRDEFSVSEQKINFLSKIHAIQKPIIASIKPNDIDVYIGIPICVSKCAYCSFTSTLCSKDGSLEHEYVNGLVREIESATDILKGKNVRSIYIGGGTPTALPAKELKRVLEAVNRCVLRDGIEFTVEAGRPDTIDEEKLGYIKQFGANRISVNAQTTNDDTLIKIGRAHTSEDFFNKFALAKGYGFDSINCDLIVGLPAEDETVFKKSLKDVLSLGAENITVHTLAIKRASKFAQENESAFITSAEAETIIENSKRILGEASFIPYYMYRQKYMAGNLENSGFTLQGHECIYNVDIMEETVDILALGGGGISKKLGDGKLERSAVVKDVRSYLGRVDEMIERNREFFKV